MLKATRYTVESSKTIYSSKRRKILIYLLRLNSTLSFIALVYLALRLFGWQYFNINIIEPNIIKLLQNNIATSIYAIEFATYLIVGLTSFILSSILKKSSNALSISLVSIPILAISFINALAFGQLTYYFIKAILILKSSSFQSSSDVTSGGATFELQKHSENFIEALSTSFLVAAFITAAMTLYSLIFATSSSLAILESTKKLNDRLIFRDGEEEYILESGTKDFENDMGELYSNDNNSIWRFEAESRGSSTLDWMYFIDNVDYKKDVRILRKGSKILGLLYTKNNGLRLKVKAAYILREPETSLITQHILAQDYIRRRKLSMHPLKLVKISKKDKETQKILSDSGWILKDSSEKNSLTVLYKET